jgi:hypothetical protein
MPPLTADAERVVNWLSTVRFCESLDCEQLAAIAGELRIRPFVAGETLASAGEEVTGPPVEPNQTGAHVAFWHPVKGK